VKTLSCPPGRVDKDIVVRCEGITHRYPGARSAVLVDLSLDIRSGTLTAITGSSGSGKSTLLYIMALLMHPSGGGRVLWDGVDALGLKDHARSAIRARSVGFVFQDSMLDPTRRVVDSVLEPMLYTGSVPRRRAARLSMVESLFADVELEIDPRRRPGEISGGQAQRIALCRAVVNRPRVIFADEPTGNLDRASAAAVLAVLKRSAARGAAVVVVTHSELVAGSCDRTLVLEAGKIRDVSAS